MATNVVYLQDPKLQKSAVAGAEVVIPVHIAIVTGTANQASADSLSLFTVPSGYFVTGFMLGPDATLGAACTLTFRVGTTALSGATTATANSQVGQTIADDPNNATADRVLNALIGGASIAASANLVGFLKLAYAR